MKSFTTCLSITFLFLVQTSYSQSISKKKLDSVLQTISKENEAGFSVGIIKGGKYIYDGGFGLSDIETHRKNTIKTPFNIGSMAKEFTAACIYLLEKQGKIRTDDPLSKYFNDLPAYADTIIISHLIHHQSGLRDFATLVWLVDMNPNKGYSDKTVYEILAKQKSLNFSPGERYSYSNSGYFYLSKIVEKISGKDLVDFASENLFKPLKMRNTAFSRTHKVKNKANAYIQDEGKMLLFNPLDSTIGDGNAYSQVSDWVYWFEEMKTQKLLGKTIWEKMTTPARKNNGELTDYAGGLEIDTYEGKERISHGGDLPGYHSFMAYFPKEDLGFVVFSNNDEISGPEVFAKMYHEIFEKPQLPLAQQGSQTNENTDQNVEPKSLPFDTVRLIGSYSLNGEPELTFDVKKKNNQLMMFQHWNEIEYQILPLNDSVFHVKGEKGIVFDFKNIQHGRAEKMLITQNGGVKSANRTVDHVKLSDQVVNEHIGDFYNPEIDAHYIISKENGKLKLTIGLANLKVWRKSDKETYAVVDADLKITFYRNQNQQIEGFTLNHIRIKDLRFVKK
jgi:CubicO group peptidase (beta-lactamase class C family)